MIAKHLVSFLGREIHNGTTAMTSIPPCHAPQVNGQAVSKTKDLALFGIVQIAVNSGTTHF